jgi:hypothetical protein
MIGLIIDIALTGVIVIASVALILINALIICGGK